MRGLGLSLGRIERLRFCGLAEFTYPVDVWSVGCIVAELHEAKRLFDAGEAQGVLHQIFQMLGWPSGGALATLPRYPSGGAISVAAIAKVSRISSLRPFLASLLASGTNAPHDCAGSC